MRYSRRASRVFVLLALSMALSVTIIVATVGICLAFTDVEGSSPYTIAIEDLAARGIIQGYDASHFGPHDPVSRQQFAKMIDLTVRLLPTEADICPFPDVAASGPGSLYPDNYVAVAAAHGITTGTGGGLFSPDDSIARVQVVTMVVRALDDLAPGALGEPAAPSSWARYTGVHSVFAARAEQNHLLDGLPLGSLDPWGEMSREEVAQVLHNALALIDALPSVGNSLIDFASKQDGAALLATRDAFTDSMSRFDRQSRMITTQEVTENQFLAFAGKQARDWTAAETGKMTAIISQIDQQVRGLDLRLPRTLTLVKTSGLEEDKQSYHRGDAVILPQEAVNLPTGDLRTIITHELFHVVSQQSATLRAAMYDIVGFRPCNPIQLPNSLTDRKITNPDAPTLDWRTDVQYLGDTVTVTPVLYASAAQYDPSQGQSFFHYLVFKLMVIEQIDGSWRPGITGRPADIAVSLCRSLLQR